MTITYRRLPLHSRLPAPVRRAFISRSALSPASRIEVWESEGGSLESQANAGFAFVFNRKA
jgi:hypothetical protein